MYKKIKNSFIILSVVFALTACELDITVDKQAICDSLGLSFFECLLLPI